MPGAANTPAGWRVRRVARTGSTNDDLVRDARDGAPHQSVLVADHQTAGRGRLTRTWEAPPGANLLVSILLRAPHVAHPPQVLAQAVGLAALRAARARLPRRSVGAAALKWPNDVLVRDAKLAGVLAVGERPTHAREGFVVVGLGLNVRWCPEGATSLLREGAAACEPVEVLSDVLAGLDALLALGAAELRGAYAESLGTLGRRVRVETTDGTVVEGDAVDLDDEGRLVVAPDAGASGAAGTRRTIDAGDVVHLRGTADA
jgi:BirA family biotin operon repressor/biotin-[acetyl-CoA-carboxylase] ligase